MAAASIEFTNEDLSRTSLLGEPVRDTPFNRFLTFAALRLFGRSEKRWLASVCMLPFGFVIKKASSRFLHLSEANTMQFVAKNTTVPVPRVYCAFVEDNMTYIVMSNINGEWIGDRWRTCTTESKKALLADLKRLIDGFRDLGPPPGRAVESVVGGPLCDARIKEQGNHIFGPFHTVRDFHHWLRQGWDGFIPEYSGDVPAVVKVALRMRNIHDKNEDNDTVFTHGDLNGTNIIVRGDKVVGIIDWETAGWYPKYWDYAMTGVQGVGDLCEQGVLKEYLDEYRDEAGALYHISQMWQR